MSSYVIRFTGLISDDGKSLLIDNQDELKADYKMLAGYAVEGTIQKYKSRRSLKQNAFFHAAIAPLAEHLGYTTEELKLALLGQFFGWQERAGSQLPIRLHTSDLNTEQFADLMAHTMQFAAEHGVVILDPSEHKAQKRKQQRRGTGKSPGGSRLVSGDSEAVHASPAGGGR